MTTRFLSVCLSAAMLFGVAAEAWAQSARRPQRANDATAQADRSEAAASEPGASQDSNAKDPFDAAEAKAKGTAGKSGSPGDSSEPKLEKATFGAGCFWHVEAEFEWLPGVQSAVSGYAGGHVPNPSYEMVHEGDTGHVEVVQVTYDPAVISYEQLLKVFWHGHDPTQWNRQGPDFGTQYRSAIFFHNEEQRKAAPQVVPRADRGSRVPGADRDAAPADEGVLPRRGIPPELLRRQAGPDRVPPVALAAAEGGEEGDGRDGEVPCDPQGRRLGQ